MTALTRRSAIKGAGAVAAAVMIPAGVQAREPLITLEAELMKARAAGNEVGVLYCAAHDKAGDWAFGWPMVDLENPVINLMRGWLRRNDFGGANQNRISLGCVKSFNRHTEMLVYAGGEKLARCKAEGRERIRWWIKARRAQEAAQEAAGIPQADALCDANHNHRARLENQLWDTPAETIKGVEIRLREALYDYTEFQAFDEGESDFYTVAFGKVLADLEHLSEEARS